MADPKCRYFGMCGGCSAQNIDYPVQAENKRNKIKQLLKTDLDVKGFFGQEYCYRNKMEFSFYPAGIGLRKKGDSKEIIGVERCEIADEKINTLLAEARRFFNNRVDSYDERRKTGTFKQAVIRASSRGTSISFILDEDSQRLAQAIGEIRRFTEATSADNVIVSYASDDERQVSDDDIFAVKGEAFLKEDLLGKTFYFSTEGFFQNNTQVARMMLEHCRKMILGYDADTRTKAHLLDLYGGVGTFGIINADLFRKATIAEFSEQSIEAAKRNIEENDIGNAEAVVLDAKNLSKLELKSPLFVILDPPRSGMAEKTIDELKRLKPDAMIYISCNPEQLAKDIQKFKDYHVKSAAMFDLFPQTNHAEAIVELERKP